MRDTAIRLLTFMIALTVSCCVCAQNGSVIFEVNRSDLGKEQNLIPADGGQPDISYISKYIAIPHNAGIEIKTKVTSERTLGSQYINPVPALPSDYDTTTFKTSEDAGIYNDDRFFPEEIVSCKRMTIRGCDLLLTSIATEQFNPVRKEKKLLENIEIRVNYSGGDEIHTYIDDEHWNEMLRGIVVNPDFFGDEHQSDTRSGRRGCNYLIITPDNEGFLECAETLKNFREEQGIITKIITLKDIGRNTPDSIRACLKRICRDWSPVPEAVLLLGDYVIASLDEGITTFRRYDHPEGSEYEPYFTDNQLVDFNDDYLPDMVVARMPAADADEARLMIEKTIEYELHPSTSADYYGKPVTAMGFQENRWFQLCTEIIAGYWNQRGKQCVKINAIHQGIPDSIWSTAENTDRVIELFGPEGLGYIPGTISHLTQWDGDDSQITQSLREGSFMVVHRDHGTFETWGEPYYSTSCINTLNNGEMTFVFSANCQTGHFGYEDNGRDCFAERLLRVPSGAVAVMAASQLSYSFVNDTYVWGAFDYLYPDFIPDYGPQDIDFKYPAFANAYGKLYLKQSSFPNNTNRVDITNMLFHYFGDAFLRLNTEMPRNLTVTHQGSIKPGQMSLIVHADDGTHIALSVDHQLIAKGKVRGGSITLRFNPLPDGAKIKVVGTKQDHYRYESIVDVTVNASMGEYMQCAFDIFPNPCTNHVTVSGENIHDIDIINILGQTVIRRSYDASVNVEVDLSGLNAGVYLLRVNGIYTRKIQLMK